MNYIDCHSHLLPGVDDGSRSMTESLDNLRLLRSQGVSEAILTPHVHSPFASRPGVIKADLRVIFNRLCAEYRREPEAYPDLYLGCEYYFDPEEATAVDPIPMAGSDYVLLELPYAIDLDGVRSAVEAVRAHGFRTLLAHPEKYDAFKGQWDEALAYLRENPEVKVQLEAWDVKELRPHTWRFIESRAAAVIGTDSHGYHRPPVYDKAAEALRAWAGDEPERRSYVDALLRRNPRELFLKNEA